MKAEFKPLFHADRVPLHEVLPLDTPFAGSIAPTEVCNIHCIYCLHSLNNRELEAKGFQSIHTPWNVFQRAVEQYQDFPSKLKSMCVAAQGEPLCNPRMPEMVQCVREAEIAESISTITNGILLTPQMSDALLDAGLDRIYISLQGMSGEKYQEICGRRIDFSKFVENIAYFFEKSRGRCAVNVKIADIALQPGDRERFLETFSPIADRVHIETIKPLYADVDYSNILGVSQEDMTVSRFGRPHKKQSACYLAFYSLDVKPSGQITVCGAPFHACPELGTIYDTTLVEAWNSEARRKFLLGMLLGKRFDSLVCRDCDYPNDVPCAGDEIDPYAEELIPKFS